MTEPKPSTVIAHRINATDPGHLEDWATAMGRDIDWDSEWQPRIISMALRLATTLIAKNKDYGDSAFKPGRLDPTATPLQRMLIRKEDKLDRMTNLLDGRSPAVKDESLIDTILDDAGYDLLIATYLASEECEQDRLRESMIRAAESKRKRNQQRKESESEA